MSGFGEDLGRRIHDEDGGYFHTTYIAQECRMNFSYRFDV
jgi:hypothetical protein